MYILIPAGILLLFLISGWIAVRVRNTARLGEQTGHPAYLDPVRAIKPDPHADEEPQDPLATPSLFESPYAVIGRRAPCPCGARRLTNRTHPGSKPPRKSVRHCCGKKLAKSRYFKEAPLPLKLIRREIRRRKKEAAARDNKATTGDLVQTNLRTRT